ncbi:MAG: hypothetical protein QXE15_00080 [Candidatus Bathyarchaeia archaeon]
MFKDLKQKLIHSILEFRNKINFRRKTTKKDVLALELEAIKMEIKKIKDEYEKRITFLENELLKRKNKELQLTKNSEELESSEELKLINDIEVLRKEVLQVLEELEKE